MKKLSYLFVASFIFWGWQLSLALNQSLPTVIYTYPENNTKYVQPQTNIAFRFAQSIPESFLSNNLITVIGSMSGQHEGTWRVVEDESMAIFSPATPFMPSETVTVSLNNAIKGENGRLQFEISAQGFSDFNSFSAISSELSKPLISNTAAHPNVTSATSDYVTVPKNLPELLVTTSANGTDNGYLFLSNFVINWRTFDFSQSDPFLLIVDDTGDPVFFKEMPGNLPIIDFKAHSNGLLSYITWGSDHFVVMDNTYEIIDTYSAGNGYKIDTHEFLMLPNGHVLIMIYDIQTMDMSAIVPGGNPNATVIGLVIQELDTNKDVVFQWRSWDHIPVTDSYEDLTAAVIDYVHGNAIAIDFDGHLLLSNRNLNEVTKINRQTGNIIWRLGGKQSDFTFIGTDEPFSRQHDIRLLDNGNYTIFDNRSPLKPDFSRAVEYKLDTTAMTATMTWEYKDLGFSPAMGSAQRMENGNTLIGWGSKYPTLTEVRPDGSIALEMQFAPHPDPDAVRNSYRAFRLPWQGRPLWSPMLIAQENDANETTLHYSWNGATDVIGYNIYAGSTLNDLSLLMSVEKTGFETQTTLTAKQQADNCLFQVVPIDGSGGEQIPSNAVLAESCVVSRFYLPVIGK